MTTYTTISGVPTLTVPDSFKSFTLSNTPTVLLWPNNFSSGVNVVAQFMDVTATGDNQILQLPSAVYTGVGTSFIINNLADFTTIIQAGDGTQLNQFTTTGINFYYLAGNSTVGGTWRISPFGEGNTVITSIGLSVNNNGIDENNLTVSSSTTNPITSTGTFTLAFGGDLEALIGFGGSNGFAVRTGTDSWALRTLIGQAGSINITNNTGQLGNPTFALATDLTGLNSITVGNLLLTGTTIKTNNNTALNLGDGVHDVVSLGSFAVDDGFFLKLLNDGDTNSISIGAPAALAATYSLTLPTAAPTTNQVLQVTNASTPFTTIWTTVATAGGGTTADAIPYFTDTAGNLSSTGIIWENPGILLGNLTIGVDTNSTIATTAGNLVLKPITNSNVEISTNGGSAVGLVLDENVKLRFTLAAGSTTLSSASGSSTVTLNLPNSVGTANYVLTTDGVNPATLTWTNPDTLFTADLLPKAFAVFNGSGGVSSTLIKGGINSITGGGGGARGQYTFAFDVGTFTAANYSFTISLQGPNVPTGGNVGYAVFQAGRTTTGCRINCFDSTGVANDWPLVTVVFWGA